MMYIPILGAFLEATGMLLERKVMKKKNINYKTYTVFGFLIICIVMLPFLLFFWQLKPEAYEIKNILIFVAIGIIALIANLLIFYSLKRETLSEFEPIRLTQPLFIILMAFIFSFFIPIYENERNYSILTLALIASITLLAGHVKKHHFVCDKYIIAAIIGSALFALELVLSKLILPYFSSWTFYFLRCLFILIIAWIIFRPNFKKVDKQTVYLTWIVSLIWVIYRAILYWGYESLGIIFTTMLLILTPIFIFIFARIFLKEKITIRQIISAIIILICVILAVVIEK